jgi:hypothetical protein
MNQEESGMAKGFVCIKCGTGTLVKSNMKMTPDGKPYCRNEVGCAARVAKQWSKPMLSADELEERNRLSRLDDLL